MRDGLMWKKSARLARNATIESLEKCLVGCFKSDKQDEMFNSFSFQKRFLIENGWNRVPAGSKKIK